MRNDKSSKARESAQKRWTKDANALPTQSECNAIKESKVNENKININVFDELYNLYNKKVNRTASLKAFNKIKITEYDAIRKHIPNFVKTFKDKQFQPYFSTYLHNERWHDEIETKKPITPRTERRATLDE